MKKRITIKRSLLTLIAAALCITASAQLREDAFIIRTTDGAAQGLLFGDVEKITFSNLDDEGVPHTGIYYQELHYPDTIIRVPVSEITEVSFEKPSIKYQSNVILGKETGLFDYLLSYSTESGRVLYFKSYTPEELLPKVDQVLTYLAGDNDILGGAFAGRVTSVKKDDLQRNVVETEQLENILDIYEELIGVEAISDENPSVREALRKANALPKDDMSKAPKRIDVSGGGTIPKFDFDLSIGFDYDPNGDYTEDPWDPAGESSANVSFGIHGGVKGSIELRLAYEFSKTRTFLSVGSTYEATPYFNLNLAGNIEWKKRFWDPLIRPQIEIVAPSAPIFAVGVGLCPFVQLSGSISMQYEKTFPTTKARTLAYYLDGIYKSGRCEIHDPADKGIDNSGSSEFSCNLDGSVFAGVAIGMAVSTQKIFKTGMALGAEIDLGPKISANMGVVPTLPANDYMDSQPDEIAYNLMKNTNVSLSWLNANMELAYVVEIAGKDRRFTLGTMTFDVLPPLSISLLPKFEAPVMNIAEGKVFNDKLYAAVSMGKPDGSSFFAVQPGIAVYGENGKCLGTDFKLTSPYEYNLSTQDDPSFENMTWNSTAWMPNTDMKIYPIFRLQHDGISSIIRAEPAREVERVDGTVTTIGADLQIFDNGGYILTYKGKGDDIITKCPNLEHFGFEFDYEGNGTFTSMDSAKPTTDEEGNTIYKRVFNSEDCPPTQTQTIYYRAYAQFSKMNYGELKIYGETKSITIPSPYDK